MKNIGIVTFSSVGHINASLAVGAELAQRGHHIICYTLQDASQRIQDGGFRARPYGVREFGLEAIQQSYRTLGTLSGLKAVRFTVEMLRQRAVAALRELPDYFREDQIDGLVVDQVAFWGGVAARAEGIPYVNLCNALPLDRDAIAPPPFSNLGPARGPFSRWQISLLNKLQTRLAKPVLEVLNQFQAERALPAYKSLPAVQSGLAQIGQLPAKFDFPRSHLPGTFHYAAPFHSRELRAPVEFPWKRISGAWPVVYVCMGTLQNQIPHVFEVIAAACQSLPVQVIISLGGGARAEEFSHLAGDPIIVDYAPQLDVLKRSAVCITHAGLNTALQCLAQGVPMLAIPVTNDQPGVAARIEYHHVGRRLFLRHLTVRKVRQNLRLLLENSSFQENAREFQIALGAIDGPKAAADIIETAFSQGAPVLREGL